MEPHRWPTLLRRRCKRLRLERGLKVARSRSGSGSGGAEGRSREGRCFSKFLYAARSGSARGEGAQRVFSAVRQERRGVSRDVGPEGLAENRQEDPANWRTRGRGSVGTDDTDLIRALDRIRCPSRAPCASLRQYALPRLRTRSVGHPLSSAELEEHEHWSPRANSVARRFWCVLIRQLRNNRHEVIRPTPLGTES